MAELVVDARREETERVIEFVNRELSEYGWDEMQTSILDISVEEIFVNIASYAYENMNVGEPYAKVVIVADAEKVEVSFEDSGMEYNPLEREDPDITLSAEERGIGGLGIYLVKKTMDEVKYKYEDGKNKLTIMKKNVSIPD